MGLTTADKCVYVCVRGKGFEPHGCVIITLAALPHCFPQWGKNPTLVLFWCNLSSLNYGP